MTQCEVDGCENTATKEIEWQEPYEPLKTALVCRPHETLNIILTDRIGKFHNVMTVDDPRMVLWNRGELRG